MPAPSETGKAMLKSYATGFVLAVLLTAIPFALAAMKALPAGATFAVIAVLALVQVLVHLRYFLHLDVRKSPRENLVALTFTAILIVIMTGGSLWIMFDLHRRMMPV